MNYLSLIEDKNRIEDMLYDILHRVLLVPDFGKDLITDFFDSSSVFMRNFSRLIDRVRELENT